MGHGEFWRGGDTGPVSPVTWPTSRHLLAIVHHYQSGDRLAEFLPAVERDPRVQTIYTQAPGSHFEAGATEYMRRLDGVVLPWEEAVRFRYDAAVAANHGHLEQVRAPVAVLPHGTGFSRLTARGFGYGPPAGRTVGGAVPGALVRYGRVVPAAVGVPHEDHRALLGAAVPEVAPIVHVVGDPAYDRARVGLAERDRHRRAAGVGPDDTLVVVSTSWGHRGLFGTHPELLGRLVSELPRGYTVAAILHPSVWWAHGPRQVRAWFSEHRRRGLRVLAPASPWLGLLAAADVVIGDQGSVTSYAAGLGAAVVLADGGLADVVPGSQVEALHLHASHYRADLPLERQLREALERRDPDWTASFDARLTSAPGRSAALIRSLLYRLMDLAEPDTAAPPEAPRTPGFVVDDDAGERAA